MKARTLILIVFTVYPAHSSAGQMVCDGTICGGSGFFFSPPSAAPCPSAPTACSAGSGTRDYVYDVVISTAACDAVIDLWIGTEDGKASNYKKIVMPKGWTFEVVRNRPPGDAWVRHRCDGLTPHFVVSNCPGSECPDGTCGWLVHFRGPADRMCGGPAPGPWYFRFAFDYKNSTADESNDRAKWLPHDVGWHIGLGGAVTSSEDWSIPMGINPNGPVHGPMGPADRTSFVVTRPINKRAHRSAPALKALLEERIAARLAADPSLQRGYESIVVFMGQCYSGGFSCLTQIGKNVVVVASAQLDQIAHPDKPGRMNYVQRFVNRVQDRDVRTVKQIAWDAVSNCMNDDPKGCKAILNADLAPEVFVSDGGDAVQLLARPGVKRIAVLFAGVEVQGSTAAITEFRKVLAGDSFDPPNPVNDFGWNIGELTVIYPEGDYQQFEDAIVNAWANMDDDTQFVLFTADHGARGQRAKSANRSAQSVSATVYTFPELLPAEVINPAVQFQMLPLSTQADVLLNGSLIGSLDMAPVDSYASIEFDKSLLAPLYEDNTIQVLTQAPPETFEEIVLSTGPVFGSPLTVVPAVSTPLMVVGTGLLLLAGAWLISIRQSQSDESQDSGR